MPINYNCDPCTDPACENLILTDRKLFQRFIIRTLCAIEGLLGGGGPAGYATEGTLLGIDTKIAVCNTNSVIISAMPPVTVTIPPGGATSANQTTEIAKLTSIDGKITACDTSNLATEATLANLATEASLSSIDGKITACDTTDVTITAMPAISVSASYWALRMDEGATYTYVGEANPGTADGAASWRIKRITNADGTIVWADGNSNLDNIWTARAGLAYS